MTDAVGMLPLPGGGSMQYLLDDGAPAGAGLLVFHHGTPAAGPLDPDLVEPARANGLQMVELVRPGYGSSTRAVGRTVASIGPLVSALADALGHERFVTVGHSGGGPHAIATAALLPGRCAGAVAVASVAPFEAPGLNWLAGMGSDNWHEFGAALAGDWFLETYLTGAAGELSGIAGAQVVEALASLLPEADRAALTGEGADRMAESLRFSVAQGTGGWHDDDMAFVAPWGIDLAAVTVPVQVWQGSVDLMVPLAHGRWLAEHIPGASEHVREGDGHLSITRHLGVAFEELRSLLDA